MKKNRKVLKTIAAFSFISLIKMSCLFTQEIETIWGDSLKSGVRESIDNDVNSPGRNAFDGNTETYWTISSGKTNGFAERYFEEEIDIEGFTADLYLPGETSMMVYWEKDGTLIPYENGIIKGEIEGHVELRFAERIRKSKRFVFKLDGDNASQAKIYEINLLERTDCRQYKKITPVKYTFNQAEYINIKPQRLWNGNIYETWYEPLWYIPWEIQQTTEGHSGIFPPFTGHPSKQAEIIWELDTLYNIQLLKVYFESENRNIAFEFWNGERWIDKKEFKGNRQNGWSRKVIEENIQTDKIRITFPAGWEMARNINQIEVWGEGISQNKERKVLVEKDNRNSIYRATISDIKEPFEINIVTEGLPGNEIEVKVNEDEYKAFCLYENRYRSVYQTRILSDSLRDGTQFLEINTRDKRIENVTIDTELDDGRIKLGSYYTDRNRENSISTATEREFKKFYLDKKYQLERIRIYAQNTDEIKIINNKDRGTYFNCEQKEDGCWEALLDGIEGNSLELEGDNEFQIREIELFGSPVEDDNISFEIWNSQKKVTENSCILGWIGNSDTKVTVDGIINMRQADNLFWMPLKEIDSNYLKAVTHKAVATLNGKSTAKKYKVNASDDTKFYEDKIKSASLSVSIDIPCDKLITQCETISLSGCVGNGNSIRVFVNGEETPIEKDRYETILNLSEGSQTIKVMATDNTGRTTEKNLEVIRDTKKPEIEIIQPIANQFINTGMATFYVDGKEEDLWWQFNDEDWECGYGRYKYKDYVLEDGFYSYTVRAQDRAGNISEKKNVSFCMDKTKPESFNILLNVKGWTNNTTPVAEFTTTDKTSGISHYEYRIDENVWRECTSPLQTEHLKDGKRKLQIRAIDKAGNIRQEEAIIQIDTSCPPLPENARPVPDENSIFIKWNGLDDNSISDGKFVAREGARSYRIERIPEWKDGIKQLNNYGYGKLKFEDTDTKNGETYSYRIWAVDRAGNESEKTEWKSAIAGLAVAEIEKGKSTVVEFEGLTISLPEGTTAEDIIRIQINKVPLSILTEVDKPLNPLVGGIYSVTIVRKNGAKEIVTNHAELLQDAVLEIGYNKNLIPENFGLNDISVFYYDDLWGSWLQMQDCYIDSTEKVIRCKTKHFTEFSVQATKRVVFTEAELREDAYSFNNKEIGDGGINISEEDGGLSTCFTEFVLPGKNGLDLPIQRVYSTAKSQVDLTYEDKTDIDGEKIWRIADGWKINMPYMAWNGNSMVVNGTDGNYVSLSQMVLKCALEDKYIYFEQDKETPAKQVEKNRDILSIALENHEYNDCMIELIFVKSTRNILFFKSVSYEFFEAVLHQSDGKKIYYQKDGKVKRITDCTGKNEINYTYNEDIINIVDSYGRIVSFFSLNNQNILSVVSEGRIVNYTVLPFNITITEDDRKNGINKTTETRLLAATDVGARIWKYNYETKVLNYINKKIEPKEEALLDDEKPVRNFYTLLTDITGPDIGYTKFQYDISKDIEYFDNVKTIEKEYKYKVIQNKITVNKQTLWKSESEYQEGKNIVREKQYKITFNEPIEKNIPVSKFEIYDGKTTTITDFCNFYKAARFRMSTAPEAIKDVSGYDEKVANINDSYAVFAKNKNITIYEGEVKNGKKIKSEEIELSPVVIRVAKKTTIIGNSGENTIIDEYKYDNLGNIIKETHTANTEKNECKIIISREFKVVIPAFNLNILNRNKKTLAVFDLYRMNLPTKVKTESYALNKVDPDITENEEYDYNEFGQINKKTIGNELQETYVYKYEYSKIDGQLEKFTTPEGNITEYVYKENFPEQGMYEKDVVYKEIKGIKEKTEVKEEYVYELSSGNLIKQKDRDGYVSITQYDAMGRITGIKKYHSSSLNTEDYSEIKVIHDDSANTISVTDELGCVSVYSFDGLGRLFKFEKNGKTLDVNLQEVEKTLTILLDYDKYDRVIKMTEPSYETPSLEKSSFIGTQYEYDSQGRVTRQINSDGNIIQTEYDDNRNYITQNIFNTQTLENNFSAQQLDEKKTVQKDNFGNTIKEILYFMADGEATESEKTKTYVYDGKGRKLQFIDANGNITAYKYNNRGLLSNIVYPSKLEETNTYNKDGYLKQITKKINGELLSETDYTVNAFGYITEEKSKFDNTEKAHSVIIKKEYDGRGNVLSEKTYYENDSGNVREKKWSYDWNGKVISETDGEDCTTNYTYDKKGNLTSVIDPRNGVESYKAEFKMTMAYDSFGRLIKGWLPQNVKRSAGYPADVYLVYDAQGNNIYRKDPENVETRFKYSNAGLLIEQIIDGYKTAYKYNGAGKTTKITNPDGTWIQYVYDNAGNKTHELVNGNPVPIRYTYDKNGNLKTITDRNDNITKYTYNEMNLKTKEEFPDSSNKTIEYDKLGRIVSETDGENNKRQYEYDMLGRIIKEEVNDEKSTQLTYEYDARGNITTFIDAKGIVFNRNYNEIDKITKETVLDNNVEKETWSYKYDKAGVLKSVTGGDITVYYNGAESDYQPDAYGNTRKEKWSKTGLSMNYEYDSLNRLTSVTSPKGKKEEYSYNKNSQVSVISNLINGNLTYTNSRLATLKISNIGIEKKYDYSEDGLISSIVFSSNKGLQTGFKYNYDFNSNITERTHVGTNYKDIYEYDKLNRLTHSDLKGKFIKDTYEQLDLYRMNEIDRDIDGMASEQEATLNGQFFPADNISLDEKGKSFVYDFGKEKEIQKIELFKNNLESKSRIRERDLHIYAKNYEDDNWIEITKDHWNYFVDSSNHSIHLNLKNTLVTRFIKIRTIWDDRDIDNNNVSDYVTFKNDSIQKMIRIWTIEDSKNEFYEYDKNSNRISLETYTTKNDYAYYKNSNNGNTARVMYDGKWWYTYDANGNRTARARNAEHNGNVVNIDKSGEYWEYEWDYHNRLVKVKQYNAPDNAANVCVEYTYDALNRRIERISRTKAEVEVTQYAYGRNGALAYQKKSVGGKDTERTFVYLNNQIIAFADEKQNETEKKYFTVTDIQGSITEVYDESENLVWKSGYTAFGILACEVSNLIDFDGLYTGCDYDPETGLTYHWNRWRSEEGNSWLSEDFARDGLNWYGYAGQNPVNFIDVIGLFYYNADGQHSSSEEYEKKDITTIHSDESNNANDNLSEDNSLLNVFTDYGKISDNSYLISGKCIGEIAYKSPKETYELLKSLIEKAGLMGKLYGKDGYVCTNFGKDVIGLLGLDINKYYPSGNLVKDNLSELKKNGSVFELGKNKKLNSGVYTFYKIYDNDKDGHTGFLYIDKEQTQIILHNGYNPSGLDSVNEFKRGTKTNFNNFFINDKKNPVYLKQIFIWEAN